MRTFFLERGLEIRRRALFGLVIAVPIFFLRFTNDPFSTPKFSLLTIGVALIGAFRAIEILQGASAIGLSRLLIPACSLAGALAVACVLSSYRDWALFGSDGRLQGLVPYLVVIFFGVLLADAFGGDPQPPARALIWAGIVVGGYAVIQVVGLDPFTWSLFGAPTEGVSTTGNPNFTGGFLGITLPVAVGLLLADPTRRRFYVRALVMIVAGWIAARSQGGWAAGIAGTAVVVGAHLRSRVRPALIAGVVVAAGIAAVTAGVVVANIVAPESRFAIDAFSVRGGWWQAAASMFVDAPVAGHGPDSFAIDGITYRTQADALRFGFDFANDPHSVPFAMLANAGLLGIAGFIAVIGWSLWHGLRRAAQDPVMAAFAGGVLSYGVQSLVSIDELSLRVALWTCVAGVAACLIPRAARAREKKKEKLSRPPRRRVAQGSLRAWPVAGSIALAAFVVVAWTSTFVIANARIRHGENLFAVERPKEAVRAFESGIALWDSAEYRGRLGLRLKELALQEQEVDGREAYFLGARDAFASFVDDVPYVFSLVSYGELLDRWAQRKGDGGDPEAVAILERAFELDPLNPSVGAALATALLHLERYNEALAVLEPQADIVPSEGYGPYWGALALAAAESGAINLARAALANAEAISPATEFVAETKEILGTS